MGDPMDAPKHKDLIYDVGMHKGEDTEFYLLKGFRVVAFEANPDLIEFCRKKLKEFVDQGQLTIVEGAIVGVDAITAGQKKVQFYRNDDRSAWGTVCVDWKERNARLGTSSSVTEVAAINFADVIKKHGVPYFIKIDCQGCDTVCLSMFSEFKERPNYISVASDKTSFANIRREIDMLINLGYSCFQAIEQSDIPLTQSPPNPPREGKYVARQFEEGSSGLFGSELDDKWKSKKDVLRQYRFVRLGYYLLGDDGVMKGWRFRGAGGLQALARRFVNFFTRAAVPGWYDTHARHSCADIRKN